jgi:hypothetical protein
VWDWPGLGGATGSGVAMHFLWLHEHLLQGRSAVLVVGGVCSQRASTKSRLSGATTSKQVADQHVRVSYMWLTRGATTGSLVAPGPAPARPGDARHTPLAQHAATLRRLSGGLARCPADDHGAAIGAEGALGCHRGLSTRLERWARPQRATTRTPPWRVVTEEARSACEREDRHGVADLAPLGQQPARQLQAPDNAWLAGPDSPVSHTLERAPDNHGDGRRRMIPTDGRHGLPTRDAASDRSPS